MTANSFRSHIAFQKIETALACLKPQMNIVTSMAAAEPTTLYKHLHEVAPRLHDVQVFCANPTMMYECFAGQTMHTAFSFKVMFVTPSIRAQQGRGFIHYMPQHLSNWTRNVLAHREIDIFWGSCSPPDERGFVSLGVGSCYEPEVIRKAKFVVLEVNERMPVTYGATTFPIQNVDIFIQNHHELATLPEERPDHIDHDIAKYVAELVVDGSTIQLGIGAIPNAVGQWLRHKKQLGIHTELINDAMLDLIQAGAITNENKSLWPYKSVGAFVYGSRALYDFIDKNPTVELQPASIVNDPYRIGRNTQMVSINSAVEIDVTGQVCSESIGHQELSGVGGASDTHVGAQRSKHGRGIIALRSMTNSGQPKIVFELKPGAKVSISRNDVDTVVTEFGVAELKGKTVSERAFALAAISHPNHRARLIEQATAAGYI